VRKRRQSKTVRERSKGRDPAGVPASVLEKLRSIGSELPEAYEEPAWVGTRWMIRKKNFAHVLVIAHGWPPAYARAARTEGPAVVLTFRTSHLMDDAFADAGPGYFRAEWGTRWGTAVAGMVLGRRVNWREVRAFVVESYRLLAPKKLVERLDG
jgi:hypothetical protein